MKPRDLIFLLALLPAPAIAQGLSSAGSSAADSSLYTRVTTGPINLTVASGQTIQSVLEQIPKFIRHPVVVTVGAGTFSGFSVTGFRLSSAAASTGASLTIQGTFTTATLGAGTASGTATGGTRGGEAATPATHGTLVDSGNSWTVNALRGLFLEITAGPGVGDIKAIESNTATTIVIAGRFSATPTTSSIYAIRDSATIISGAVTSNADFFLGSTAALAGIVLANNDFPPGTLLIQKLKFTSVGFYGIYQQSPTNLFLKWCRFEPGGSLVGVRTLASGSLRALSNTWPAITGATYAAVSQASRVSIGNNMGPSEISLDSNVFVGSGGNNGVMAQVYSGSLATNQNYCASLSRGLWLGNSLTVATSGDFFTSVSNQGISTSLAISYGSTIQVDGDNFSSCGIAINLVGRAFLVFTAVASPGSGNTSGIVLTDGARVVSSATGYAFASTTDITVNTLTTAITSTAAAFRALSPKVIQDANTQTTITEA